MKFSRVYKKTTRLMLLFLSILIGLSAAKLGLNISGWWILLLLLLTLLSFRKARLFSVYMVVALGFSIGIFRGSAFDSRMQVSTNLDKKKITVRGKALTDSIYDKGGAISFDIGYITTEDGEIVNIPGKIGVSGYGESMIYRGDEVSVTGKFVKARGSYTAWMSYSDIELGARSTSKIFAFTRRFAAGLQNALPDPQASFGLGILIGQRDTLPESTSKILATIGLTHIIAVSGYNLTILVRAARRLFARASKFQSMFVALCFILVFLLITGAQPSIVRASIISVLSLLAWYYGRNVKPLLIIFLTAALTALWNPMYLWSDIGWYLSFFAFFGVLILSPIIKARLYRKRKPGIAGELIIESFAAQLMTLPIILFIFNESSYVVLLANLVVALLIPLGMLLTFIAGLAGMFIPFVSGWLSWPANVVLSYTLDSATLVARIPNMQFSLGIDVTTMMLMYAIILGISYTWWRKVPKNDTLLNRNYFD